MGRRGEGGFIFLQKKPGDYYAFSEKGLIKIEKKTASGFGSPTWPKKLLTCKGSVSVRYFFFAGEVYGI